MDVDFCEWWVAMALDTTTSINTKNNKTTAIAIYKQMDEAHYTENHT